MPKWTLTETEGHTPYGPVHFRIGKDWRDPDTFSLALLVNDSWVENPWLTRSAVFDLPNNVCHAERAFESGFASVADARMAYYGMMRGLNADERYAFELGDEAEMRQKWGSF